MHYKVSIYKEQLTQRQKLAFTNVLKHVKDAA